MSNNDFIVRVTTTSGGVELHEFNHKKKAIEARDRFRRMENVASAKMFRADDAKRNKGPAAAED